MLWVLFALSFFTFCVGWFMTVSWAARVSIFWLCVCLFMPLVIPMFHLVHWGTDDDAFDERKSNISERKANISRLLFYAGGVGSFVFASLLQKDL